jgi:hypothetical protein
MVVCMKRVAAGNLPVTECTPCHCSGRSWDMCKHSWSVHMNG